MAFSCYHATALSPYICIPVSMLPLATPPTAFPGPFVGFSQLSCRPSPRVRGTSFGGSFVAQYHPFHRDVTVCRHLDIDTHHRAPGTGTATLQQQQSIQFQFDRRRIFFSSQQQQVRIGTTTTTIQLLRGYCNWQRVQAPTPATTYLRIHRYLFATHLTIICHRFNTVVWTPFTTTGADRQPLAWSNNHRILRTGAAELNQADCGDAAIHATRYRYSSCRTLTHQQSTG